MPLVLALPFAPSFSMKNSAVTKLARMAKKAMATKYVMLKIIR